MVPPDTDKTIDPKKHERLRKKPPLEPKNTELSKPGKTRNPDIEDPDKEASQER